VNFLHAIFPMIMRKAMTGASKALFHSIRKEVHGSDLNALSSSGFKTSALRDLKLPLFRFKIPKSITFPCILRLVLKTFFLYKRL
jgi:hypothetical protein